MFLEKSANELAHVLSKLMNLKGEGGISERDQFEAILRVLHDAMIQKEMKHRKVTLSLSSGMRDGQECMNFFLDLINDCAGYTEKYYEEICPGPIREYNDLYDMPKEGRV